MVVHGVAAGDGGDLLHRPHGVLGSHPAQAGGGRGERGVDPVDVAGEAEAERDAGLGGDEVVALDPPVGLGPLQAAHAVPALLVVLAVLAALGADQVVLDPALAGGDPDLGAGGAAAKTMSGSSALATTVSTSASAARQLGGDATDLVVAVQLVAGEVEQDDDRGPGLLDVQGSQPSSVSSTTVGAVPEASAWAMPGAVLAPSALVSVGDALRSAAVEQRRGRGLAVRAADQEHPPAARQAASRVGGDGEEGPTADDPAAAAAGASRERRTPRGPAVRARPQAHASARPAVVRGPPPSSRAATVIALLLA